MQLTDEKKKSLIKNLYYIFINFTKFFLVKIICLIRNFNKIGQNTLIEYDAA